MTDVIERLQDVVLYLATNNPRPDKFVRTTVDAITEIKMLRARRQELTSAYLNEIERLKQLLGLNLLSLLETQATDLVTANTEIKTLRRRVLDLQDENDSLRKELGR